MTDEGKTEDRRLSAGDVLGLHAPATTPNLRTVKAISAAEAAAATLDAYNAEGRVGGENTIDAKEDDRLSRARERAHTVFVVPSRTPESRRESIALQRDLENLMVEEVANEYVGAAEAASAKKKKKKKKKKANMVQWYGVTKGLDTGWWYTNFAGIKHLVHGVKPSLYEGFPTEREAKDFVLHHRDHHEGAKQKSARKARADMAAII